MNKKTLETALGVTNNYRRQYPDLKATNLAGKSSGTPRRQKRTNPAWELQTNLKQIKILRGRPFFMYMLLAIPNSVPKKKKLTKHNSSRKQTFHTLSFM